jgi:hypothetical protein
MRRGNGRSNRKPGLGAIAPQFGRTEELAAKNAQHVCRWIEHTFFCGVDQLAVGVECHIDMKETGM